MGTGQGKLPQELVTDNALLKRKYESEELEGAGTPAVETAATFAAISPSTAPRTVIVIADETNGGERTVYFHDGSTLNWLPTVGLE